MPKALLLSLASTTLIVIALYFSGVYDQNSGSEESQTEFEHRAINTLPYLNLAPVDTEKNQSGVTKYVRAKTSDGLNFFNSTTVVKASILDMEGHELHSWTPQMEFKTPWQHTQMLPDGSILAVAKDKYIAKISWHSKVIWVKKGRYHHDVSLDSSGRIYTIKRAEKYIALDAQSNYPIVDDRIEILSATGELISDFSVYDLVKDKMKRPLLHRAIERAKKKQFVVTSDVTNYSGRPLIENSAFDVLHTNTVLPVERDVFEGCKKGDLLISVRNIDLIGCVDSANNKLRWSWGQRQLSRQHHPNFLKNGNILIFNNRPRKKLSEVVELNPKTSTIDWKTNELTPPFFSITRGSAQRLPNGNTLIGESDFGRVLEVTADQELVWEYFNSESYTKRDKTHRGTFYRFSRLSPELAAVVTARLKK